MAVQDKEDLLQMYGRMMAYSAIESAIESGQFVTLDDVLVAVKQGAEFISNELRGSPEFGQTRIINAEEFFTIVAAYELENDKPQKH